MATCVSCNSDTLYKCSRRPRRCSSSSAPSITRLPSPFTSFPPAFERFRLNENSCAVRDFLHSWTVLSEMVEVVDLTLTDDEDDVAVDNRDEEVVEVVVNREVRGAAGAANRVDDDDEVMVTGTLLGTPFPFLRPDASTSHARARVEGASLRCKVVLGPFRAGEPGATRDDASATRPFFPQTFRSETHLDNLFFHSPREQEWSETTLWWTSPTRVTLARCSSSTLRDTASTARTAGASLARPPRPSFSEESNNKNPSAFSRGGASFVSDPRPSL